MKTALGLLLGFMIGVICSVAGLPLPAPPVLVGALLVVSMTAGYLLVDRLETLGLIMRKKDPTDRRGVLIELSAAGLALVDQAIIKHLENERRILAPLTTKQRTELADLLRSLLVHLEKTETQGS